MNALVGLRDRLTPAAPSARQGLLVEAILQVLCDELGCDPNELHPRSRFETLGIDSKRALEFKEVLEEELGCALRTTLLFDFPSPESLAGHVVGVAFGEATPEDASEPQESPEERLRRKLTKYDL
ncbi:acyl carrier protein [Myxococcus sp. SDU36]|uniref:acyl carrier protein n=1 Tax=Myxococcus sp. SDU36 TaxID=2831967 RepID=UPI0025428669|nr:acyl carrier protein [Myxococcus sp. SDU36]WIG98716.1 acyl carrier protein [Myxococcus sp. SDU36]